MLRRTMATPRLLLFLLLASIAGCGGKPAPEAQPASEPQVNTPQAAAPAAPQAPTAAGAATPASSAPPSAGGLTWQADAPLARRAPKSAMRAAEYGVSGDETASLTVFYFGSDQGGSVEANVKRWLGQFKQPDGSDSADKATRNKREVNGIPVSTVEVSGSYNGGMSMTGEPAPAPDGETMLLGAIAEGTKGPVFFKLVGPRATVERARPAFDALVNSLHAQ
jgi:hypothetical protein